MKNNKKVKSLIIFLISSIVVAIGIFYLNKIVNLINTYGFNNILINYKNKAQFIYFIICFLQPIILPLPEPVTIMAGSTVLGPLMGAIIGFSGTILGIITMFFISKFARTSIISKMIDEKKLDKFNRYIENNETLITLMLFILPILPDEVICVGAGLAKMNGYKFILVASIAKLLTSVSLSYSLELIKFDIKFIVVAIISVCAIVFIKKSKLCVK